jgi:WD40 repeat protein
LYGIPHGTATDAFAYDPEFDVLVGCTEDGKTRFLVEKGAHTVFEYDSSPVQHTAVLISKRQQAIFFGTSHGSVRVFLWPVTEFQKDNIEYIEFPIHQSAVVSLKLTHDNSTLITASEDGSIFLLKLKEYIEGNETTNYDILNSLNANRRKDVMGKFVNAYLLNPYSLVGRPNMEGKRDQIKELEFKIQNAKSDIEDIKEKYINDYNQRIKSIEEKVFIA